MVGERIRQRRKELGYSLRALGIRTSLTASFLSQVENNQSSPSLASLQRIATALEVPMFAFLDGSHQPSPVVRAGERLQLDFSDADICYELASRNLGGQLMAIIINLRGRLTIVVDEHTYTLDPGDTISYGGRSLREFAALGDEEVQVLCCLTPPVL
jgi:transcriptional regulator with XRE-family HTH domain